MRLISSSLTIFFKIFIPTFWITFVGFFTMAVFFNTSINIPAIQSLEFRIGTLVFFISGIAILYYLFMRLKRVEVSETHVYVTNYWKTYRYPYSSISKIDEQNILGFTKVRMELTEPGSFGKKFVFIASRKRWNELIFERPEVLAHLRQS